MSTHEQTVLAQFDAQARAYLTSAVHAQGPDLVRAQDLARHAARQAAPAPAAAALDVGCGAGHLSFAIAPDFARVVALDPAPGMLAVVRDAAAARHLPQIETVEGAGDRLPFADESFDLVCSRKSAHHWRRIEPALRELRRVLKPGGHLLMIDTEGEEDPLADTHLQTIELLRDRSHVRSHTPRQWQAMLAAAGFAVVAHETWPLRLEFASWVERMRTPPDAVAMIRRLQAEAPAEVRQALGYEEDGSFTIRTGLYWASPAQEFPCI